MSGRHKPVGSEGGLRCVYGASLILLVIGVLGATARTSASTLEKAGAAGGAGANFTAIHDFISTNKSGARVLLRVHPDSEAIVFSLPDRLLEPLRPGYRFEKASLFASGIEVQGWREAQPKLRGPCRNLDRESSRGATAWCEVSLGLDDSDVALSLAFANSGAWFALGARESLRVIDRRGKLKWSNQLPATEGVVISGDENIVVSAHEDGVVRWHRAVDGVLLLSLFVHEDGKRWFAWTPEGYYDASAGGEDLMGWTVGSDADNDAYFYPASRFRRDRYRPPLVQNALRVVPDDPVVQQAPVPAPIEEVLPPRVVILSPKDGAAFDQAEVTLQVRATTRDGREIDQLRVLIDGVVATAGRGVSVVTSAASATSDTQHVRVAVPPRDVELAVIAEAAGATSVAAITRLRWAGTSTSDDSTFEIKPALYVLSIGVSDYADPGLQLRYAAKDARDFSTTLNAQAELQLYRDVTVRTLVDQEVTRDDVLDALDWIERQATDKDVSMVFLAGHGVNDNQGDYYYLPADADIERLRRTALPYTEIQRTIERLAGKKLFFVDTCHAGNASGRRAALPDVNGIVNELASAESGAVVFASSTGRQYSLEHETWQNGAFTKAVVEGLQGEADYASPGRITVNELDLYIAERVKELTGGRQTPTTRKPETVPDFPLVMR